MDHVQTPEADVLIGMEDVLSKSPSDKLHDSKHAVDFIQNEVQSYDNVFVPKNKPSEVLENGDHPSSPEEPEQVSPVTVHVDQMNGSTHESKPSSHLTPQADDESVKSDVQRELPTDISVHSSTPGDESSPNADLLREVGDISPIKTFDLVDIEKPAHQDDLLLVDEPKLFQTIPDPDIIEKVDSAQFHLHEKAGDLVEEPIKPADIAIVPDSCDLISNKAKETKSTPSPVEPAVTVEAEQPKSKPKIVKETAEATKCEKPAVTTKANPSEKSEIGPKDFFAKYGLGKCLIVLFFTFIHGHCGFFICMLIVSVVIS